MGFVEALLLTFIILKLVGVITWSWWLVLLPLYGDIVLYTLLAIVGFGVFKIFHRKHQELPRMEWPRF